MTRLLLVDDDPQLVRALGINLRARGYEVTTAPTGTDALDAASRRPPDVVVLDLGLPDLDGVDVVTGLRGWSTAPILVLSARHGQQDKVEALDAGADDYLTKPFGMNELLARLRALARRSSRGSVDPVVRTDSFSVDLANSQVLNAEGKVRLTPTEWRLLEVLVRNEGRLVSQTELLRTVWGPRYGTETNYLRVYIGQLRRKLETDPGHPQHILTEPGMGYRFVT